jgi:hypothetical protein
MRAQPVHNPCTALTGVWLTEIKLRVRAVGCFVPNWTLEHCAAKGWFEP